MTQAAGNAVKRATEALVRSAQQASGNLENSDPLTVNERMVGGIAQVTSVSPASRDVCGQLSVLLSRAS